jgi:hypothetical protein
VIEKWGEGGRRNSKQRESSKVLREVGLIEELYEDQGNTGYLNPKTEGTCWWHSLYTPGVTCI